MKMTSNTTLRRIAFLLAIVTVVSAFPKGLRSRPNNAYNDPAMEKYLREAIENFRIQMREGLPAINLPRLDPLELRDLDMDFKQDMVSLSLKIKQLIIRELSQFHVKTLNADLSTFFLRLKLSLPATRAKGFYSMDGKIIKIFPLYGNGNFSINLTRAEISGEGKLIPKDDTLQMEKLDLDLTWDTMEIFLENFLGGGAFSKTLQKLLPSVGKNIFNNYKPQLLNFVNRMLMKSLNDMLRWPAVKDIVKGLIPK